MEEILQNWRKRVDVLVDQREQAHHKGDLIQAQIEQLLKCIADLASTADLPARLAEEKDDE